MIAEAAVEKPSLQRQRVQQYVFEAKYLCFQEGAVERKDGLQLIAAATLRKALLKFEQWAEARPGDGIQLVSLTVRQDMLI